MATSSLYGSVSESTGLYGIGAASGGTYFEWFVFYDSATAPATPTGGSWDFTTNTGTAPTGWLVAPPASPVNQVWVSIAIVDSRSSATLTWTTPGLMTGSGLPILTGSGTPSSGTGLNGQLYVNTATTPQSMYLKESGAWVQLTGATLYATAGANSNITSLSGITGGISSATYLQLNTAGDGAVAPGKLQWDTTWGGPQIGMIGGNVNLQVGQETLIYVYNNTGSPLIDGQVVYCTGSQGQRLTVALALANSDSTSAAILGVVTEPIANNSAGFITTQGMVNGVNTNGFADGAVIYLSPTVAGAWTTTKPQAPQHLVQVGYVVKGGSSGAGSIYINTQNGYELDELHDVRITSVTNGNLLRYNSTIPAWENIAGPTGTVVGTTDIQTLTNKTISGASNTLTNIGNSSLSNSSVTINGNAVSLGGSTTITAATPNSLTFGTGLSATSSFNGSTGTSVSLQAVGTAGTFGSSGQTPVLTVNSVGQITNINLQNVTVDTSDITGTIAIAQGGTGASSAANALQNLLPDYSGNAGKVFALNSSGTATEWRAVSGTGTVTSVNASGGSTGLSFSGGPITAAGTLTLAGTLATANGGTGKTSYTANGVVYASSTSALASGNALTFDGTNFATTGTASATKLIPTGGTTTGNGMYLPATNTLGWSVNGAEAMRLDGNLLIGTTTNTNSSKLVVNGTISETVSSTQYLVASQYDVGTAPNKIPLNQYLGNMAWQDSAYLNVGSIYASGNVGLGTAPSAWVGVNAYQAGRASIYGYSGVDSGFQHNAYFNSGWKYVANDFATQYQQASGAHKWFSAASGTAGNAISFTQAMTLDVSGNLGVGTTSPAATLHIRGGGGAINSVLDSSTSADTRLEMRNSGTRSGYIYWDASENRFFADSGRFTSFYTGGSERARIDSSGNLLVGLTSATGTAKLQVSGPLRTTGYTVATLPAGTVGMRTYVTDALAPSFGATVVGGGAVTIPVFYNGTNWIVA